MLLDPDPLKIDRVHQRLMAGPLGPAIVPRWSFVSITEISEYVQSPEQFGERLVAEGMDANSAEYKTRLKGYADRLVDMNRQRLTPDFPPYPATCFYPMNKKRKVGENWFTLSKEERSRLMIEHARSGMAFAGRVSQLITVGLGLRRLGMGRHALGREPGVSQRDRLPHAVRRSLGPLRGVRAVLHRLCSFSRRNYRSLPD